MNNTEKKRVFENFKKYVNTYSEKEFIDEKCFIDDMIYGIGISLDKKYEWSQGYDKFKNVLMKDMKIEIIKKILSPIDIIQKS